jgi:hypothetical protein
MNLPGLPPVPDAHVEVLPNTMRPQGSVRRAGLCWVPIYCANCGKLGGHVPEETTTFAFFLCPSPCAERWGNLAHTYLMPDEVFWAKVNAEQLDRYARLLGPAELLQALEDDAHPLAKLAKEQFAHD